MNAALEQHRQGIIRQVGDCIREYFDPKGGLFTQRVRGLVGQGGEAGELERIIRRQLEGDGSLLAKTLVQHTWATGVRLCGFSTRNRPVG